MPDRCAMRCIHEAAFSHSPSRTYRKCGPKTCCIDLNDRRIVSCPRWLKVRLSFFDAWIGPHARFNTE